MGKEIKEKVIKYSEKDRAIVNVLKNAEKPMTIAEISAATGLTIVAGNIVSAMNKGLVEAVGEATVERPSKKTVGTYVFATKEVTKKADGKDNAYSDSEKAILGVLESAEKELTLAEIGEALGRTLTSGSINGLVKKGNVTKGAEVEVTAMVKSKVKTYAFVADIPEVAENN